MAVLSSMFSVKPEEISAMVKQLYTRFRNRAFFLSMLGWFAFFAPFLTTQMLWMVFLQGAARVLPKSFL